VKLVLAALCVALPLAHAQQPTSAQPASTAPIQHPVQTFHLRYATVPNDQNEIVTAIRNMVSPQLRVIVVPSRNEIVATGNAEDLKTVATLIDALDKPQKVYRLTYTITESDGGKRIGLTRYTMVLAAGQRMQMKQGSRVPLVTGGSSKDPGAQRTYLDVGMNFDSEIDDYGTSVRLRSKVEQSSLAEEKSGIGPEDPVIRQTLLEGVTVLSMGKALPIGAIDIVGSTRRIEVTATVDQETGG
jgi:hypothetical protein